MSISTITATCKQLLFDLKSALDLLTTEQYQKLIPELFNSSIGQHTRHIIEFFQCLEQQASTGVVDYDLRQRNLLIESSTLEANNTLTKLIKWLNSPLEDQLLKLATNYNHQHTESSLVNVQSSLIRELVYNIEHTIHHMAIIKIGLRITYPQLQLPKHFGVAPSTLRYHQEQTSK